MESKLYRGQGPLMLKIKQADGTYGPLMDTGAVSAANFSIAVEELKHRESRSGKRAVDKVITTSTECTVSLTVENFSPEMLGIGLQSDISSTAAGAVADHVVGDVTTLNVGDLIRIPFLGISDLVLVDSTAGTPVTLVAGTHYEAISEAHGMIRLLSKTGLTGNIKAAFDHRGKKQIKAMSAKKLTARVMFLGINTAEDDEPSLVEAEVQFKPASAFNLINDDFGTWQLDGDCVFTNGAFFTVDGVAA